MLNTMLLLDRKNGRFHWKKEIATGVWEFISDEENTQYWNSERERLDKIAADCYNKVFSNESK